VIPDVTTGAAAEIRPTSAALASAVNPDGLKLSDCHFDYGPDASYGETAACVPGAGAIPADSTDHPVSANLTGLEPGVTYHFRLEAANGNGSNFGQDATFSTPPDPSIDGAAATNLTESEADLEAKINPNGLQTSYHLEWGTSTAYGTVVPAPGRKTTEAEENLGAGTKDVPVKVHLTSLEANRTYHYRFVASNANGTRTGADHTFVYDTAGEGLPDHRAYELVTPAHKNGAHIGVSLFSVPPAVASDGSRVVAPSIQCYANAESCTAAYYTIGSLYAFERTSDGWQTTALSPSAQQFNGLGAVRVDANTGAAIFDVTANGQDQWYEHRPDGSFVAVGPVSESGSAFSPRELNDVFATGDLSRFIWSAQPEGLASRPWPALDPNGFQDHSEFFEYAGSGNTQPDLLMVAGGAGSRSLISACGTALVYGAPGALSEDGRVFYATTEDPKVSGSLCPAAAGALSPPVRELFARVDSGEAAARSVAISEPPASSACTTAACLANTGSAHEAQFRDAQFDGAAADGSAVFFASTQQLTNDATQDRALSDTAEGIDCNQTSGLNGCNLYLSECEHCQDLSAVEEAAARRLLDVSSGEGGPVPGGPRVRGVVAVSSDGSHVYFVARGVLSASANGLGQTARDGANNLYVFARDRSMSQGGRVTFVTTLPESDRSEWRGDGVEAGGYPPNVTPDGRFLVFRSHGRLTPDDTSLSGATQVFRYDAQSGQLIRISIGNDGFNDNGNRSAVMPCGKAGTCAEDARIVTGYNAYETIGAARRDPTMSDNGEFVFFQSPVGLTPHALDDVQMGVEQSGNTPEYAQNVYEWHEGHVHLISDGRDVSRDNATADTCQPAITAVCLLGTDASGANVFFATADELVPQDTDTELDYYDARICEPEHGNPCISPGAPALPPCLGEVCHGTPAGTPALAATPSASFNGQGNLVPPSTSGAVKPRAATRAQKLARSLRACRADRNRAKRRVCEGRARRRYGSGSRPRKAAKKRGGK
jgi:hypothetical protein